ncbi:ABC transporter ATP-binding protein [Sphaerimonospora sp. CA-214678]|uniref:ABC transporter ATP-binding protein n=1 Tax=Sphaerimonospora sp. CA-214678 TaxID=3240029 RepID=UPI003D8C514D
MNLLELNDLTVRYGGVTAVDGITASVSEGSLFGLIGPNGAGKTTMIDAITGMVRYTGTVVFDKQDLTGWQPHRRSHAGLVRTFQSLELFNELTVRENLETYAGIKHGNEAEAAVDKALELMSVTWAADLHPPELSHGQARLVSVARALAAKPRLLLLDEPAAGLDAQESQWLGQRLRAVVDQKVVTVILVDHDVDLIMNICDEILVLDFGKEIGLGSPAEVRANPRVAKAYLGTDGSIDSDAEVVS